MNFHQKTHAHQRWKYAARKPIKAKMLGIPKKEGIRNPTISGKSNDYWQDFNPDPALLDG